MYLLLALMASDRCWMLEASHQLSGKQLWWQNSDASGCIFWSMALFFEMSWKFLFFEMYLKCLVKKLLIVSAWFLVHVGWFMFQRFWIEILIGLWFMLVSKSLILISKVHVSDSSAANWKGSHWILRFLNNPLIKSEVLIDMILQSSHWILLSMDSMVYGFLQHFATNG